MQIKDVHVVFHVLVTWFIQKSGKYAYKISESVIFEKNYGFCLFYFSSFTFGLHGFHLKKLNIIQYDS